MAIFRDHRRTEIKRDRAAELDQMARAKGSSTKQSRAACARGHGGAAIKAVSPLVPKRRDSAPATLAATVWQSRDDFFRAGNCAGVVRHVDVERGMHHLIRVVRRRVFHHGDVVAELGSIAHGRFRVEGYSPRQPTPHRRVHSRVQARIGSPAEGWTRRKTTPHERTAGCPARYQTLPRLHNWGRRRSRVSSQ